MRNLVRWLLLLLGNSVAGFLGRFLGSEGISRFNLQKNVNKDLLLFFAKLGYITMFLFFFTRYYSIRFTPDEPYFGCAFQVLLELSLFLFMFWPKAEKEAKWLLITSSFCSVIAALFLKNVLSLDIQVFIIIPLLFSVFYFCQRTLLLLPLLFSIPWTRDWRNEPFFFS